MTIRDDMSDRWTDRLSDHLDGDLPASERAALEQHLATCEACRVTLEELRRVKMRARSLEDPSVPDDLWAGIASRIGSAGSFSGHEAPAAGGRVLEFPRRRAWLPAPAVQFAIAAGIALLLVAAGVFQFARPHLPGGEHAPATQPQASLPSGSNTQLASFDPVQADGEIAQLHAALAHGRGRLSPHTVLVLEKNLRLIEAATDDARRALAQDPANRELQDYFARDLNGKLAMMRRATALAGV